MNNVLTIDLRIYKAKLGKPDSIVILCPSCFKRFDNFETLKKHYSMKHKKEFGYEITKKRIACLWWVYERSIK